MTVVPLVFALVVLGVNSAPENAAASRRLAWVSATFLILLALAAMHRHFSLAPFLLSLLP